MITIYHNPACGTSRNVLGLIRNSGVEPLIVEYLKTPPSRDELIGLLAAMKLPARNLLRRKGTPYESLQLDIPSGATLNSAASCSRIRFSLSGRLS